MSERETWATPASRRYVGDRTDSFFARSAFPTRPKPPTPNLQSSPSILASESDFAAPFRLYRVEVLPPSGPSDHVDE